MNDATNRQPAAGSDATHVGGYVVRMLVGSVLATTAIPAIGFFTGFGIAHHAAVQLAAGNVAITGGVCPTWTWHWMISPNSPCAVLNDASSLQLLSAAAAIFALGMPLLLIFVAFLVCRRPRTMIFGMGPVVWFHLFAYMISRTIQIVLLLFALYLTLATLLSIVLPSGLLPLLIYWFVIPGFVFLRARSVSRSWGRCPVHGLSVSPDSAPGLWRLVERVAGELEIAKPDNLIINQTLLCFVTRARVTTLHKSETLYGNSLCLSSIVVRMLTEGELHACISHELAHIRCGLSPHVVRLAQSWVYLKKNPPPSWVFWLPFVSSVTMTSYLFSKFVGEAYPALEAEADRVGARVADKSALVRALIKQTMALLFWSRFSQPRAQTSAPSGGIELQNNNSLWFADLVKKYVPGLSAQEWRGIIRAAETNDLFPYHPSLVHRAAELHVNFDQAAETVLKDFPDCESSFEGELVPIEEELTRLSYAPKKPEIGETVSPRSRVFDEIEPSP